LASPGPDERFWFIELIAYWEGRIASTHLCTRFRISRQQASKIINKYKSTYPNNLIYDSSLKGYLPSTKFSAHYISGDAAEYLRWVTTPSASSPSNQRPLPHVSLELPPRQVRPELMRGLVTAMRTQSRVDVDYVSLTNPNREGRIIAPHTFINTGLRWHLRAWCEKSQEYRDFVLSRFRGDPHLMDKSPHTAEQDEAWNTQVTLIFEPDTRFDQAKRDVIIHDYNMQNGQLRITTRAALVHYLIQEMQVNTKFHAEKPEAQQLVLVNKDDVKEWLFGG
jgi:hypothetical protein